MQDPDDFDQTLVPEAFLELYVVRGRPTLARAALQARHDFAETLACQAAAMLPSIAADDLEAQARVLRQLHAGLAAEPPQVSASEARWVIGRVAELLDYGEAAVVAVTGRRDADDAGGRGPR